MKLQQGKNNIAYLDSDFYKYFGEEDIKPKEIDFKFTTLDKPMTEGEMLKEYDPKITIEEFMSIFPKLKKSGWYLFFIGGCLVRVDWGDDGWGVRVRPVRESAEWLAGSRLVSRNLPLKSETSNPESIKSLNTLEERVTKIESWINRVKDQLL